MELVGADMDATQRALLSLTPLEGGGLGLPGVGRQVGSRFPGQLGFVFGTRGIPGGRK